MLLNLNDMLFHAKQNLYAVPQFDVIDRISCSEIISSATSSFMPVLLNINASELKSEEKIISALKEAESQAEISINPVCITISGTSDAELIKKAFDSGASSVFLDLEDFSALNGGDLPKAVSEIIKAAHSYSGTTEITEKLIHCITSESTDSSDEKKALVLLLEYLKDMDIDVLSIDTTLSLRNSPVNKPILSLEHIVHMARETDIPLSAHLVNGYSEFDLIHAVGNGVCKIDFPNGTRILKGSVLEKNPDYITLSKNGRDNSSAMIDLFKIVTNR
ncbi:MAG: class II fructose-bisphosphate aldolase [Lachnospiraceae bacterium]|jgi:fructose-bisphosphate aldolase class II